MSIQSRLDRLTRRQYGLITRSQALSCGLTAAMIRTRLERGEWLEMRPSVYAVAGAPQSREQGLLAVLLAHGPTSLASHGTATHHWRLKSCEQPDEIEVVSSLACGVRLDGVRGHRSGALFDADCTASRGIPIVTAERSLDRHLRPASRSENSARPSTTRCGGGSSLSSRSVVAPSASRLRRGVR